MAEQHQKYALITGCTPGGIGHYLALEFAEKGFQVLATVRDPSKYTSPNANITYHALELANPDSIAQLHENVARITGGKLHILYNNAGRNYTVPALDVDMREVQETFEANFFSVMRMCQTFAPMLIEAKGTIVQTGSVAALMPYAFASAYCASKGALHAYTNTLRIELKPLGVRVLNIITGGVMSNIARTHRKLPEGSYYLPLAAEYESRLTHSQQVGMDTQKYARKCVAHVLGGDSWFGAVTKRWAWEGSLSGLVWFAWNYVPHAVFDWYFTSKYNLSKLKGTAGPDKKSK